MKNSEISSPVFNYLVHSSFGVRRKDGWHWIHHSCSCLCTVLPRVIWSVDCLRGITRNSWKVPTGTDDSTLIIVAHTRWSNIRVYNVRPRYCVTLVFALYITTLSSVPITLCTKHFDMISSTPYSLVISYGSKQIAFPHWIIAASSVKSVAFLGQIPFLYTEVVCFLA